MWNICAIAFVCSGREVKSFLPPEWKARGNICRWQEAADVVNVIVSEKFLTSPSKLILSHGLWNRADYFLFQTWCLSTMLLLVRKSYLCVYGKISHFMTNIHIVGINMLPRDFHSNSAASRKFVLLTSWSNVEHSGGYLLIWIVCLHNYCAKCMT